MESVPRPTSADPSLRSDGHVASSPSDDELRDLMRGYQRGDIAAFDSLYARIAPRLRSYMAFLTGNAARAEDLLQECFMQIHRSRATYSPARPFKPWAFAIARHVFKMDARATSRRKAHEARYPSVAWTLPVELERLASRDLVAAALSRLSPSRREALVLHHAFGLSFREIAAVLGIRPGTAKLRAHRGMTQLRTVFRESEERRGDA